MIIKSSLGIKNQASGLKNEIWNFRFWFIILVKLSFGIENQASGWKNEIWNFEPSFILLVKSSLRIKNQASGFKNLRWLPAESQWAIGTFFAKFWFKILGLRFTLRGSIWSLANQLRLPLSTGKTRKNWFWDSLEIQFHPLLLPIYTFYLHVERFPATISLWRQNFGPNFRFQLILTQGYEIFCYSSCMADWKVYVKTFVKLIFVFTALIILCARDFVLQNKFHSSLKKNSEILIESELFAIWLGPSTWESSCPGSLENPCQFCQRLEIKSAPGNLFRLSTLYFIGQLMIFSSTKQFVKFYNGKLSLYLSFLPTLITSKTGFEKTLFLWWATINSVDLL